MANIVDKNVLCEELNEFQANAALKTEGAMLILAGAGSGKTRTITFKIAHLISEKHIDPRQILAVTFTNKAAKEMKERIQKILDTKVNLEWMGTFHSVCVRILRLCLSKAPIVRALGWNLNQNFTIYDDEEQKKLLRDILKEQLGDSFEASEVKKVHNAISHFKNSVYKEANPDGSFKLVLQTPEMVKERAVYKDQELMALYYAAYQKKLMDSNALDFDDILLKTVELLGKLPMIAEQFAHRFQYVFVDEYQDTNDVQYELLKLLTKGNRNITVVGDDDQSIYGWRGANIDIIRNFHKDFSPVTIVKLEENYRSTANIVQAAGSVIARNVRPKEMQKRVFSSQEPGDKVLITFLPDDRTEAEKIAKRILDAGKEFYSKTAIFYRTNAQSRVLEKALNDKRIPNVIFGGTRFYDRKEIKDILAYLRVISNPKDDAALFRILNVPARQIGKTTAEFLKEQASMQDTSVWEVIENHQELLGKSVPKIASFKNLILKMKAEVTSKEVPLPVLIEHIIADTFYKEFLEKDDPTTAEDKCGNLDELVNAVREFEEEHPEATLDSFLQDISLLTDADKKVENANERVTLMTIHMAKGLEFHTVHIGGVDENVFPLVRSFSMLSEKEAKEQMEEERRLFYVGCTRAQKKLFLYHTSTRFLQGMLQTLNPSRFLKEMDMSVAELREESFDDSEIHLFDDDYTPKTFKKPGAFSTTGSISRNFTYAKPKTSFQKSPYSNKSIGKSFGKTEHIIYKNPVKVPKAESTSPRIVYDEYSENPFQVGVQVRHPKYGSGVLLKISGQGENTRVEVRFKNGVVRTLILKYAGLEIIS